MGNSDMSFLCIVLSLAIASIHQTNAEEPVICREESDFHVCYRLTTRDDFLNSVQQCDAMNGTLADINEEEEVDFLLGHLRYISKGQSNFWAKTGLGQCPVISYNKDQATISWTMEVGCTVMQFGLCEIKVIGYSGTEAEEVEELLMTGMLNGDVQASHNAMIEMDEQVELVDSSMLDGQVFLANFETGSGDPDPEDSIEPDYDAVNMDVPLTVQFDAPFTEELEDTSSPEFADLSNTVDASLSPLFSTSPYFEEIDVDSFSPVDLSTSVLQARFKRNVRRLLNTNAGTVVSAQTFIVYNFGSIQQSADPAANTYALFSDILGNVLPTLITTPIGDYTVNADVINAQLVDIATEGAFWVSASEDPCIFESDICANPCYPTCNSTGPSVVCEGLCDFSQNLVCETDETTPTTAVCNCLPDYVLHENECLAVDDLIAPGDAVAKRKKVTVRRYKSKTLTCELPEGGEGYPLAEFYWNTTASVSPDMSNTEAREGRLTFIVDDFGMAGDYTCTPYNIAGTGGSATTILRVKGRPATG